MELSSIIPHIEALIFASEKPLTALDIVELVNNAFGFMEERITLDQVESSLEGIREKYNAEFYAFEVRESGGGWQFLTKKDYHKTIAQLNGDKFIKRLSTAAMETLAIIAYKQPITKGEIESIRGVNSDYSIQKLLEKELIVITGRNENLPGKPLIYATSKSFMDYFGINSTDDLPKIKEVLAEQLVEPTLVKDSDFTDAAGPGIVDEGVFSVDSNGDLVDLTIEVASEEIVITEEEINTGDEITGEPAIPEVAEENEEIEETLKEETPKEETAEEEQSAESEETGGQDKRKPGEETGEDHTDNSDDTGDASQEKA